MEAITIDELLKSDFKPDILRYSFKPYNMDVAKEIFAKIGQKRGIDYKIDNENEFVIENIIRWVFCDPEIKCLNPESKEEIPADLTKGIYIAGNTGTGKSLILEILSSYLSLRDSRAVFLGKIDRYLTYPYFTTTKVCDFYQNEGDLSQFIEAKTICFQDLGANTEQPETLFMGTRTKVMQTIIQERGDKRGLITFFSSNNGIIDPDTLKLYGDRGVSRLRKMCNYYELVGKDRRIK